MTTQGMDVEAARALAATMQSKADEIDSVANLLNTQLGSLFWEGADAMSYRSDWSSVHYSQLVAASASLRDAATRVTSNASAQETTSAT
jgi:uncharacterized protein YukE